MTTTPSTVQERLRSSGRRMTAQRRVIAEAFDEPRGRGEHVHLTAEQVLASARAVLPEVSLATVYNTLNDMVSLGVVAEVSPDDGPKRYDPNVDGDHHHLVCTMCGTMVDVHLDHAPRLAAGRDDDFEVHDVDVTFRGRCSSCRV